MKKALLIGINYNESPDEVKLQGCIEDVVDIKNMLINDLNYNSENIIQLTDNQSDNNYKPTTSNIMNYLQQCISESNTYSEFWLHYSGHGSQFTDNNGDELDGKDEVIIPSDYQTSGAIGDDTLRYLLNQIKCKTFIVMDCCHSGSNIDLPHQYRFIDISNLQYTNQNQYECENKQIYKISGSRDDQVSLSMWDVETQGYRGACTHSIIDTLKKSNYDISLNQLIIDMNIWMNENMSNQCPTLASTDQDCLNINFSQIVSNNYTPILSENEKLKMEIDLLKQDIEYYKNMYANSVSQLNNEKNNIINEKQLIDEERKHFKNKYEYYLNYIRYQFISKNF